MHSPCQSPALLTLLCNLKASCLISLLQQLHAEHGLPFKVLAGGHMLVRRHRNASEQCSEGEQANQELGEQEILVMPNPAALIPPSSPDICWELLFQARAPPSMPYAS